jgi:hypothetical protein
VLNLAVVGYGYWGPNIVRNVVERPELALWGVCETNPERVARFSARYPGVHTCSSFQDVLDDPAVDAVSIATPPSTHYALVERALEAGKHVLVEKPLATTVAEAERLVDAAAGVTPRALRDRALVELLYGAGLRVSEACGLERGAVDLQDGHVAARVAAEQSRGVLLAVRRGDGEVGVAFEDVRGGDHVVGVPGEAAGREAAPTVDREHRASGASDRAGEVVGQAGQDAAGGG